MPRRMPCSLTIDQVVTRWKTETRRSPQAWTKIRPGDRLTLVDRCMGLKQGEKQQVLAPLVEVVKNRIEPILAIDDEAVYREGFNGYPLEFAVFWAFAHALGPKLRAEGIRSYDLALRPDAKRASAIRRALDGVDCRVIEWRYLDDEVSS